VTLATHQPIGIRNPTLVRAKEAQLLALLRDRPGLRVPQICEATGEPAGAVADRLQRLLRRGEVEKIGREWRLPVLSTAPRQ
jgi:DNA-binding IclR family transcriptional regulator